MKVARDVVAVSVPRTTARRRRPLAVWPLAAAMGVLSLGGFVGGIAFVTDPTGASLGARLDWLTDTPVSDFLLPGLFLLGVYAIGTAVLVCGLVWRPSPGPMIRIDRRLGYHWAWGGTIAVGLILVAWILYELAIFSDRIVLQPILLGVGALMVLIPCLPSMRNHYRTVR